jgi:hypothetical protein
VTAAAATTATAKTTAGRIWSFMIGSTADDVFGSSPLALSYRANFVPGGAVERAASHKLVWYREVLAGQPPRGVFKPFALDELLKRLQCLVSQASVAHEGLVWFSTHRWLGFAVARAGGRQLASRLPWGGLGEGM